MSKWVPDEMVGASRHCRVVHEDTGATGYRSLAWGNGGNRLYGPVFSGPNCTSKADCEILGLPLDQADVVLCAVDADGAATPTPRAVHGPPRRRGTAHSRDTRPNTAGQP